MNYLSIRRAAIVPLFFLFIYPAFPSDNSNLAIFAKTNADKFKSEIIETKGISVGSTVTVTGKLTLSDASYDDEKGEMVFGLFSSLASLTTSETCKATGAYQAQNAFGAKARVTQKVCNSIDITENLVPERNHKYISLWNKRVKMTTTQYREIIKNGIPIEVTFTLEQPSHGYLVKSYSFLIEATIRNPKETLSNSLNVTGHINGVSCRLPGSNELVTIVETN